MKTIVYIDGLNLYYAALRGTTFKWLDPYSLFQNHVLGSGSDVAMVRYYTAPAKLSSSDDPASPQRQHRYLRALKAHLGGRIDIVQGVIARSTPFLRLVEPTATSSRQSESHSDLAGALASVRRNHPNVVIGLVAPVRDQRRISGDLRKLATWYKALNPAHLVSAQLPDRIPGTRLSCPDTWKQSAATPAVPVKHATS